MPLEIVLVDDHPLFVEGLALLLPIASGGRITVTGYTAEPTMTFDLVRRKRPHLALVDVALSSPDGATFVGVAKRAHADVRVLALSPPREISRVLQALHDGADGCLYRTVDPNELLHALLTLANGWSVLPADLLSTLVAASVRPETELLRRLDQDERALWAALASGATTSELARRLIVSERTAKRHVAALLRKLGARNRAQAAALAGRCGLLDACETMHPHGY